MKSILQQIIKTARENQSREMAAIEAEIESPHTTASRRSFLKNSSLGGIAMAGFLSMPVEDTIARTTGRISRYSYSSNLRITDMRYTTISNGTAATNARNVIIRIDTNQGIYGLGEVRDGADYRYALFLKSRLLGLNPCNVEMIFKAIKQFGGHGRMAGGVCGVEMALWDLAGKAYEVPAWALLGGKYRDKIRLYSYIPNSGEGALASIDLDKFRADVKHRIEEQGFTWLKMHPGIEVISKIPGATVNTKFIPGFNEPPEASSTKNYLNYQNTKHAFTAIQVTDKGLAELARYVETIRNIVGYENPM
jgi:L-alanine-DL-glutamate epimerase-like enolase superfamily enzyme